MNILIVDDDSTQRELLSGFLHHQGYPSLTAANGPEAMKIFQKELVHLVLLDYRMPGQRGNEVLEELKSLNPIVRVIMITGYSDVDTAVTVMKLGADEFMEKPVNLMGLLEKIRRIEEQIVVDEDVALVEEAVEETPLPIKIVAESPLMKEVLSMARRVAESPWPVLIQGETGTGKELIARLIHLLSDRRDAPFIEVNCAAIPENLFESELFGHEKGAFTGALNKRRGFFELAHGGTLLLDEIGEMPLSLQPKLLRVLQEKKIHRVGSEVNLPVDVRLVSASNRDLKSMVEENHFREDLYYRLKVLEVQLPPLRQRREDIPPLVEMFLKHCASQPPRFSQEALDAIIKYPFPGNVRELEHMVQRTVTMSRGAVIRSTDLPEEIRHHRASSQGNLMERLEAMEQEMIYSALKKKEWVQTQAADLLGISERVLRYKMKKYAIRRGDL